MGNQVTEEALGSRDTKEGGHGAFLVPGILPTRPWAPSQLSRPRPPLGLSPAWPWGPVSLLFTRQASPQVTAPPTEWGKDDRWRRCHFNQSLLWLGKGRREPRAGGG